MFDNLDKIEEENKNKINSTKEAINQTKESLEKLKIQKENYLKLIETHFNNLESILESQLNTLTSNIDILQTKDANSLEEILQVGKQVEWIYEEKQKPFKLKMTNENFEKKLKNSIKLVDKDKIPEDVYTQIDLLRHCNWKAVKLLCEKYEEYDDLLLKAYKAEALKELGDNSYKTLCKELTNIEETDDPYWMVGIGKAFTFIGDESSAFKWFEKSAKLGNSIGELNLGFSYDNGLGCEEDKDKGYQLFKLSASKGNIRSIYNLGVSLENGDSCNIDYFASHEYYEKAARAGLALAQYNIALQYEDGTGCEQNMETAKKWLHSASDLGYEDAKILLEDWEAESSESSDYSESNYDSEESY
eukprot:gene6298-10304_t